MITNEDRPVIWESTLDDRYHCFVARTDEWSGELTITDTETGEELLREAVKLLHRGVFGTDVEDIRRWKERAVEVVDSRKD